MLAPIVNNILSILTIAGQIMIVLSIVFFINFRNKEVRPTFFDMVSRNALTFAFIVALIAMLGSLTYSDILGYEPCKLCWLQRICMYPQVILLGIAAWKKDFKIIVYSMSIAIPGALIALNHFMLQVTNISFIPCSAVGYSVSCSKNFVLQYGYITIPIMALTAFLLIIVFLLYRTFFKAKVSDIMKYN